MKFENCSFEASYGTEAQLPTSENFEIVFSGKSNVGKSSLLNSIMARKTLAKVSSSPGKTGTINFFDVDGYKFVDLPGYGYAKVSNNEKTRWAKLVEGYFSQNRNIKLVVQLLDFRHTPTALDFQMLDFLEYYSLPYVLVLTKKDKLNKTLYNQRKEKLKTELEKYSPRQIIEFSTVTKDGLEELRRLTCSYLKDSE